MRLETVGVDRLLVVLSLAAAACAAGAKGDSLAGPSASSGGAGVDPSSGAGGTSSVGPSAGPVPDGGQITMPGETNLPLSPAPAMPGPIKVKPNRSSVLLYLPAVPGAKDYRVFAVEKSVSVSTSGDKREHVAGATLHCSGLRQRNQCDEDEILPVKYNNDELDLPRCTIAGIDRRPNVPTSLMQSVEVNGIGPNTTLVVEALDRQCPFPGLLATFHKDVSIGASDLGGPMVEAVVNDKSYTLQRYPTTFPLRTETEIRADYGSMILNGQGPNLPTLDPKSPSFPESPYVRVGHPAPADDPIVLARSVIQVSPLGNASPSEGFRQQDYFDDFDDAADQPKLIRDTDEVNRLFGVSPSIKVYATKKWILYDGGNGFSDFFVDRGQLVMTQGDAAQGSMSNQAMYPKRPVHLPSAADQYLHVTYEVQRNETPRRYENLTLCGSDKVGQTYDGEMPRSAPLPRPGFMNEDDTARTSVLGWNCLLLIPRGAGYGVVPGGDIASHPDSGLKITVVRSHPAPATADEYDHTRITQFATAFGPTQESPFPKRWLRQIDSTGAPSGVWLDDQLNVWQRTRFDAYIRRDRVVVYVEGQQRICQDLDPSAITMAEGALGFWHVVYHTSAEFTEIRRGTVSDDPSTGQHHIMHNIPFGDQRSYDNVGFQEDVPLPSGNFEASRCYKSQ